jgi:ferredoxin-NADP reductase
VLLAPSPGASPYRHQRKIVATDTTIAAEGATQSKTPLEPIEVRITDIRSAARDTNIYEFRRVDGKRFPSSTPGAHIDIKLPTGLVRQYSLLTSETDPESYTIAVKRDPAGRGGSSYMHTELKVGQTLRIKGPRNNFPLVDAEHVVLIAGGIGITPIFCMTQQLVTQGRSWKLYYSSRSRADMAFLDMLTKHEPVYLHFDDEAEGKFLDIAKIVAEAPKNSHLYCCGPMPMLKAFEAATEGWPRNQIHVEYFAPKQEPAKAGGFVVELAKSKQEFVIPPGKTILEVLLDAGIYVDHSCELGICGLCETPLISGTPEHRDAFLTDEQKEANKSVMVCCAGAKSDRLVLDL